jgi:transposase-like protein
VMDILVQSRRDQRGGQRFFRKLLKSQEREPRRLVTDKLRSYEAAHRAIMPSVVHDTERYANNRAEVLPEPVPPDMSVFFPRRTMASRMVTPVGSIEPKRIRSVHVK